MKMLKHHLNITVILFNFNGFIEQNIYGRTSLSCSWVRVWTRWAPRMIHCSRRTTTLISQLRRRGEAVLHLLQSVRTGQLHICVNIVLPTNEIEVCLRVMWTLCMRVNVITIDFTFTKFSVSFRRRQKKYFHERTTGMSQLAHSKTRKLLKLQAI